MDIELADDEHLRALAALEAVDCRGEAGEKRGEVGRGLGGSGGDPGRFVFVCGFGSGRRQSAVRRPAEYGL
ncbi:hypothetical protein [Streptomyces sp. NPDC006355]|uniref:hypothetical protein n=1 Tax=Streptomyces sp. NPDC006355 TaxID=3156758 RepID=UPI0033A010D0